MSRPVSGPVCNHGKSVGGRGCRECKRERVAIMERIRPLVDLFWDNKGKNAGDLEHLMFQAYKMGDKEARP